MLDDATAYIGHGFVQSNSVLLLSEVATSLFRFPCIQTGILLVRSENKRLADQEEILDFLYESLDIASSKL